VSELASVLDQLAVEAPVDEASWQDVVARARRSRRRRLTLAVVLATTLLALALPALGIGGRLLDLFSGDPVSSDELSPEALRVLGAMSAGVEPRLPASAQESMARVGAANLRRIATRDGDSFYVADRAGGGHCLTITHDGDRNPFVSYLCSPDFPSPKQPIEDESAFGGSPEAPVVRRLEGFAADGVASIEVVTVNGSRVTTSVQDNVYLRTDGLPRERVREIVAADSAGSPIYTMCLLHGGCAP
jgi:hypothetical protein